MPAGRARPGRGTTRTEPHRKGLVVLAALTVLAAVFALCLVSALQLLVPRDMPFGVTGPSPVVSAVQASQEGRLA